MRPLKQLSWDTVAKRISLGCSVVSQIRLLLVGQTLKLCLKTRPKAGSEKKGGRRKASLSDPGLVPQLKENLEAHTAGSPVNPGEIWTNQSNRQLAEELASQGHSVDPKTVGLIIEKELELGRRQLAKTESMAESKDREQQFEILQQYKSEYLSKGFAVLSIDTKKKELLGNYHRSGPAWGNIRLGTWDHDFPSFSWGKVIPYGVYDLARNDALMYLAQGFDTGQLAVEAVRRWWFRIGKWNYPANCPILLLADCGGSNGYRVPLFREHLQRLADLLQTSIRVCHLPPYCSKYNPIDHRLFCHVSRSLNALILHSVEVVRDAIAKTKTRTGLLVLTELARRVFPKGVRASQEFRQHETTVRDQILPHLNYQFHPQ